MRAFFSSARDMVTEGGEIHVTHKISYPYNMWKLEELAVEFDLHLLEEVEFRKVDYPGYYNKRGYGRRTNKTFPVGECSTFKFGL